MISFNVTLNEFLIFAAIYMALRMIEDGVNGRSFYTDWQKGHNADYTTRDWPLGFIYMVYYVPYLLAEGGLVLALLTSACVGGAFWGISILFYWVGGQIRGNEKGDHELPNFISRKSWQLLGVVLGSIYLFVAN